MGDLENLLLLDGEIFPMDNGYWVKFEAKVIEASENIPHGVRKTTWDHIHKKEETFPYEFDCAGVLMEDFWNSVNYYLENH